MQETPRGEKKEVQQYKLKCRADKLIEQSLTPIRVQNLRDKKRKVAPNPVCYVLYGKRVFAENHERTD